MRPPEFTGGNAGNILARYIVVEVASMRPPEFTGGNVCTRFWDGEILQSLQ